MCCVLFVVWRSACAVVSLLMWLSLLFALGCCCMVMFVVRCVSVCVFCVVRCVVVCGSYGGGVARCVSLFVICCCM